MFFLSVLCPLTLSGCTTISNQLTQVYNNSMNSCFVVTNSFFWRIINTKPSGISGDNRGGIYFNGNYPVNVTDSTFIECSSTWGGGVCVDKAPTTLERCCGTNCSSTNGGQFVQFGDQGNDQREIAFFLSYSSELLSSLSFQRFWCDSL
jgi:hypothetical protein